MNPCHFCRSPHGSVDIKCRCGACDGMEQVICKRCFILWRAEKNEAIKLVRAAARKENQ